MPLKPPVTLFQRPSTCSIRIAKASVTIARYRPETRIAGRPTASPTSALMPVASTMLSPKGRPWAMHQACA